MDGVIFETGYPPFSNGVLLDSYVLCSCSIHSHPTELPTVERKPTDGKSMKKRLLQAQLFKSTKVFGV